jgi:hypothetical protein
MPFPEEYMATAEKCIVEGRANMTRFIEEHLAIKHNDLEEEYASKKYDAEYVLRKDALAAEKKKLEQQADAMMEKALKDATTAVASEQ